MEGVADAEKLLLTVQLQFVQGFGVRLAPKAVELLTVDANDKAQICPLPIIRPRPLFDSSMR